MINETEFWELCLDKFSKRLTNQQINTWIKPLTIKVNKDRFSIYAPNQFVLEWVKGRFDKE
ncbi:MAG: chromosomal replication initiator protein DnaA, partial [Nitrosomonadales bacterium]|nr:chromosomal replication initiator protein DnaA [Nitrosomonadales bacterium]